MIISASYSLVATLLDPIAPLAQVDPLTLAAELVQMVRDTNEMIKKSRNERNP